MQALRLLIGTIALSVGASLVGCTAADVADADPITESDSEVKVDTRSPEARRQYDANVAFASSYAPRCTRTMQPLAAAAAPPRVLVTGFGRFRGIQNNATGRIVSTLVPGAPYPETEAPAPGEVDDPAAQLSVGTTLIDLPGVGPVEICGMILPVSWDLAAIVIAREIEALQPSFVMMNGVAGPRQPIWIELGATNRAAKLDDGSSQLRPAMAADEPYAKIIESAPREEDARGNLLTWAAVRDAARAAIVEHEDDVDQGVRFGSLLPDAMLAGYPRSSNTYLCNNVTYVTSWLMSHPGREVRLLRASPPLRGRLNEVRVRLQSDHRAVPRAFVHWPSELADTHHAAAAAVAKAIIAAQLTALAHGDLPVTGDNTLADESLQGGDVY